MKFFVKKFGYSTEYLEYYCARPCMKIGLRTVVRFYAHLMDSKAATRT
jgi:hypothetical protein